MESINIMIEWFCGLAIGVSSPIEIVAGGILAGSVCAFVGWFLGKIHSYSKDVYYYTKEEFREKATPEEAKKHNDEMLTKHFEKGGK